MLCFDHRDAKHCTADVHKGLLDEVGVDLFDDEFTDEHGPQTSIYVRFADGTRFPARTVTTSPPEHFNSVLQSWGKRGEVHDYRTMLHGRGVSGVDMRQTEGAST